MDAALIQAGKDVALDAIKILGPALIAAIVAYRTARVQLRSKLDEIESTNEFQARKQLFEYYSARQRHLSEAYDALSESIGKLVGLVTGYAEGGQEEPKFASVVLETLQHYAAQIPTETAAAVEAMKLAGLEGSSEFKKLNSLQEKTFPIDKSNLDAVKRTAFEVLNAQHFLVHCHQMAIESNLRSSLQKYLK